MSADLERVLARLVADGTLDEDQAAVLRREVASERPRGRGATPRADQPADQPAEPAADRELAQLAGYVGAGLLGLGSLLVVFESWGGMRPLYRAGILLLVSMALIVAGALYGGRRRGTERAREPRGAPLAATQFAVAAVTAAAAGAVAVPAHKALAGGAVGLTVAVIGYVRRRSELGHVSMLILAMLGLSGLGRLSGDGSALPTGSLFAGLGCAWAILSAVGVLGERRLGIRLAAVVALVGAQLAARSGGGWWGYVLTLVVAGSCHFGYFRSRDSALFGLGVLAGAVVLAQLLYEGTGGSLSISAVLFGPGVSLLVASVLAVRLRRQRG